MAEDCKSIAKTSKKRSFNATTSVLVYILDENDNGPEFLNSSYSFNVKEDVMVAHEVGRVFAEDKDAGQNGYVTYRILAGNSVDR